MQYARALLDGSVADQHDARPSPSRDEQSSASGCVEDSARGPASPAADGAQPSSQTAEARLRLPEKRVSNSKMKRELGVVLRFPSYREGLRAIHAGDQTPFD